MREYSSFSSVCITGQNMQVQVLASLIARRSLICTRDASGLIQNPEKEQYSISQYNNNPYKNIANEPFYDPEYINIIDINNFTLNIDFIKNTPTRSMDEKIKNYSIGNYINKLLQ